MNTFKNQKYKDKVSYILAVASFVFGYILLMLSFWVEPTGVIDNSVLAAFGSLLVFSASLLGISMHYGAELERFKTEIRKKIEKIDSN